MVVLFLCEITLFFDLYFWITYGFTLRSKDLKLDIYNTCLITWIKNSKITYPWPLRDKTQDAKLMYTPNDDSIKVPNGFESTKVG